MADLQYFTGFQMNGNRVHGAGDGTAPQDYATVGQVDAAVAGVGGHSYTATIGDGTATSYPVTHNLGSTSVTVQVTLTATGEVVFAGVAVTNTNTVTVSFAQPPTAGQFTVVVLTAPAA